MYKKLIPVLFGLCLFSCFDKGEKPTEGSFLPIDVGSKWVYSYYQRVGHLFSSLADSGFRTIEILSKDEFIDSTIYTATVVDSAYFHKLRDFLDSSNNSDNPYVDKYQILITEKSNDSLFVEAKGGEDGMARMLKYAFIARNFPDSSITIEEYQSQSREVINFSSPWTKYVKGIGLVFYSDNLVNHPSAEWKFDLVYNN